MANWKVACGAGALAAVVMAGGIVRGEWPGRVFAPYMYIGAGDDFKLTACDDACGVKYYTLGFIIARQEGWGKEAKYFPEPAWDGRTPMEKNLYADQIAAIRKRGGDVIMSFGGEAGKELANEMEDVDALEGAYQKVIDQYHFTWLDFDVEGSNLEKGKVASERRNTVLARLQKKNAGLIVSYTLPVDPEGLSDASVALLKDAVKKGVKVHSVNLMVMYFGKKFIGKGKTEGELGVASAKAAHGQLQGIDPGIRVGLCPCLGENGSKEEVFGVGDAKRLKAFAEETPWVCSLHYWSINDDGGKKGGAGEPGAWAFARIFETFTR